MGLITCSALLAAGTLFIYLQKNRLKKKSNKLKLVHTCKVSPSFFKPSWCKVDITARKKNTEICHTNLYLKKKTIGGLFSFFAVM